MKSRPCLVPWGVAFGSCSLDSPEGQARQDQNFILAPAVLEPGALGARTVHWDLPALLASPHHDFGQSLRGLSFLGPCDSSRAELHGPWAQAGGLSFPQVTPGLQVSSQGWPNSGGGLGLCLPQTSHPVRSQLGHQSWHSDRLHLDEQGRSPDHHPGPLSPLVATLHGGILRGTRAHFWVPGRIRRTRSWKDREGKIDLLCRIGLGAFRAGRRGF